MAYLEAAWWFISSNHLTLAGAITMGLVIAGITRRNLFNRQGKGDGILFSPPTLAAANHLENLDRSLQKAAPSSTGNFSRGEIAAGISEHADRLAAKRGSKVIPLIHDYVLVFDEEEHQLITCPSSLTRECLRFFLSELETLAADAPLDIVLHSCGADGVAAQQIARAIKAHKGETTVFIPYYANGLSGLIALAADRVVMAPNAHISFVSDGWEIFANSEKLEAAVRKKGARNADDETLLKLHQHKNAKRERSSFVCEILHGSRHGDRCQFGAELAAGKYSESNPIGPHLASSLGLKVSADMPSEARDLVKSFQFHPVPQKQTVECKPDDEAKGKEPVQEFRGVCLDTCNLSVRPHLKRLEERRDSSALCVIHTRDLESSSVDEITAIEILRVLGEIDPDVPLDVILHTPGGNALEGMQIARAIKAHRGKKTVFVPFQAFSAGTIIALAADEIVMGNHAVLGPIDAQVPCTFQGRRIRHPASAYVSVAAKKSRKKIDDQVLATAYRCNDDIASHHKNAVELMRGTYSNTAANRIVHRLNDGILTHGYPVTFDEARAMGLRVSDRMPSEPREIVQSFLVDLTRNCSVTFCSS